MTQIVSTDDKETLLGWIEGFLDSRPDGYWGTWEGRRPPVFPVHVWNSDSRSVFAIECSHGFRGGVFSRWDDHAVRLKSVPECPRCLSRAKTQARINEERALGNKRGSKLKDFAGRFLRLPAFVSAMGASIVAGLVVWIVTSNWEWIADSAQALLRAITTSPRN